MQLALVQFYKDVIESLWTIENWTSQWALVFDELELSSSEEIQLFSQQVNTQSEAITFYGTRDYRDNTDIVKNGGAIPDYKRCWPHQWEALGEYNYISDAQERIIGYMKKYYPQKSGSESTVSKMKQTEL